MKRSYCSFVRAAELRLELFHAVEEGSLHDVQVLEDQGKDSYMHAYKHQFPCGTVMHLAAYHGHQHLLSYFLSKGLDINTTNSKYSNTPLHRASEAGHVEVVQFLLDQNANMHAVNLRDQKPIHMATKAGHKDIVEIFLEKGMDVKDTDGNSSTLLHLSCLAGKLNLVQLLVNYRADIHAKDANRHKPIHIAAKYGCIDIVQLFLNRGMNVNEPDNDGYTPLHLACRSCGLRFVEFLVDNNADIHVQASNGRKAIDVAVFWGQKDVVEYFLNLGMSIDDTDENGETVLHLAAYRRHLEVVQLLVDRIGANPQLNAQDNKGRTPMHTCYLDPHIMNCLLDAGARSDIKDNDGRTMVFYFIHDCIRSRQLYHQSILAKMHNFVDIDDQTKMTAAHLVVNYSYDMDLVKLVVQHQNDLNVEDRFGKTPMNYLTENLFSLSNIASREIAIRLFVNHGAYLKVNDCERIVQKQSMKKSLFTDAKFCSQCLVNKFDNKDLPMLGRLPSAILPSVLEILKLKSNQIRLIESAVEEEIRNKGHYCDFSKMPPPPLLSILAIESYISHYRT